MSPEGQQEALAARNPAVTFLAASHASENAAGTPVVAFKFGGSSLLGAPRLLHAARLVANAVHQENLSSAGSTGSVVVVVSAMKGITDRLLAIARRLEAGCRTDARRDAEHVLQIHLDVLRDLQLSPMDEDRVSRELRLLGHDMLHDASPEKQPSSAIRAALYDRLASYGERFSARLFAATLEKIGVPAVPVSASDFVLTCDTFREARPQLEETRSRGRDVLLPLFADGIVPVVTGFIGATRDGRLTTLGRNSSDFSGALVAHIVDASELVIWTDVDGIYTANPHHSADAQLLHELSYDQAHALAAAGAKVLHSSVLPLAAQTGMVVWVRNTFNPQFPGTRIGPAVAALPRTCHSERSESALAGERSRGISASTPASPESFSSGCYNPIVRGEA